MAPPQYDAWQSLLDEEARAALAEGNFPRAWNFFWRLLQIDPYDVQALRESGRIAHAMGRFDYAIKALGEVDSLNGTAKDPEIHYLRGEAYWALGKKKQALVEYDRMIEDLGPGPWDRRSTLWIARVDVLRGDRKAAMALYQPLLDASASDSAEYAEVALNVVEADILARDWSGAKKKLREFLVVQPDNDRARAMLAWVLEGQHDLDAELPMRAEFAEEWSDHPQKTLEYARALERAYDYPSALKRYKEARTLGVKDASPAITRLEHRLSPEIAAGLARRDDPSGLVTGWSGGAAVPLTHKIRLALSATRETTSGAVTLGSEELTSTGAAAWASLAGPRGSGVALGTTFENGARPMRLGAGGMAWTGPDHALQLQLRGDANLPWRESASTIREGGTIDQLGAQVFVSPGTRRVVASFGVQGRRLGLMAKPGMPDIHARQLFGSAGLDVVAYRKPGQVARGEVLDTEMLMPRYFSTATVLSYRHYELSSEDPFGERLVLVERSSYDEVSGVMRQVLDERGIFGAEVRGGLGYDWGRSTRVWRAGASLLLSATSSSRLTADYDVANETGTGLSGRRHVGSVVLHVDL